MDLGLKKKPVVRAEYGRSVFKELDRTVYEPVRFMILEKLIAAGKVDFSYLGKALRQEIDLTDGNLGGHLLRLENEDYIQAQRKYQGRRHTTLYSITDKGRKAFQWFLIGLARRIQQSSDITRIPIALSSN